MDGGDGWFRRRPDVVWRIGVQRVLLRCVRADGPPPSELGGLAAAVWVALDEPRPVADVAAELEVTVEQTVEAITMLVDAGWLLAAEPLVEIETETETPGERADALVAQPAERASAGEVAMPDRSDLSDSVQERER